MFMNIEKNKIIKNASWIIVCRIAQSIINLVIGMISARYLGPSNYGIINYAGSIVAFMVPVVQLGFRNTFVQEVIAEPDKEGEIIGTILASTLVSSFLGIIGIAAFVSIVNRGQTDTIIVCVLYSGCLIFQMMELIQYWYQAKLLSKYTSIVSLCAYAVVSLYKVFLLITGKSIYWFAVSQAMDYFLVSSALIIIYFKLGGQKLKFSFMLLHKMFAKSKYYILSGLMVTIYQNTDRVMLSIMLGEEANGYYSAAITCAGVAAFVFSAIIDSGRPVIFEGKKKSYQIFEDNITKLFSLIIYLGFAQSIFFTVMSKLCVGILYGQAYAPAAAVLRIITWYSTFSYMGSVRNIWILSEGKQHYLLWINLIGAIINIVGNYILIPLYGASGAAIASVATYFFVDYVLCFVIREIRPCSRLIVKSLNPNIILSMIRR